MTGWPEFLYNGRDFGPSGTETPGGALTVDEDLPLHAADPVPFELGHVVTDVVNQIHTAGCSHDPGKDIPDPVGDHMAVGESVIHGRAHGPVVPAPEFGTERRMDEFAVGKPGGPEGVFHEFDVISGDLVAPNRGFRSGSSQSLGLSP